MGLFDFFNKKKNVEPLLNYDRVKDILIKQYSDYNLSDEDYCILLERFAYVLGLKEVSIENYRLLKCGQDAIVFEGDDSIVKITTCFYNTMTLTDYVSNSDFILKPNIEVNCDINNRVFTVLEFDKLDVNSIKRSDVISMYCHLRDDGYLWYDPRCSNLGKDKDGKVYLIDYGQIVYIYDKDYSFVQNELSVHKNMFSDFDEVYNRRNLFDDCSLFGRRKR